jgi:hypothetical protein
MVGGKVWESRDVMLKNCRLLDDSPFESISCLSFLDFESKEQCFEKVPALFKRDMVFVFCWKVDLLSG